MIEHHQKISDEQIINNPSDHYRLDRYDASRYFALHKKRGEEIAECFKKIHNQKQKVVYADICGRATGEKLGADKSYCFSFKTPTSRQSVLELSNVLNGRKKHEAVFVDGDIFNSGDFAHFLAQMKKDTSAPALVTFEPVAGLGDYQPIHNTVDILPNYRGITYQQLGRRLQKIVEILRPGGYVYIARPFQMIGMGEFLSGIPQKGRELSLDIKKFARKLKCKVDIHSDIGGPYFLLRKSEKSI